MNKAFELLSDSKFSIHKVTSKVGFSNKKINFFSKAFKKKFGLSPLEYKQSLKQKAITTS